MTYNVFSGTLNPTQSTCCRWSKIVSSHCSADNWRRWSMRCHGEFQSKSGTVGHQSIWWRYSVLETAVSCICHS